MAGDTHEVNVCLIDINRDFPNSLRRICVKVHAPMLPNDCANLFHWLNDTSLVIYCHDGDERGVRSDGSFEGFQVNNAIRLDWQIRNIGSFFAKFSAGVQYAFVLLEINDACYHAHYEQKATYSLGGDDMLFLLLIKPCHAFYDHIVTLRGARGEDDIFRLGTNEVCNMLTSTMR